MDLFSLTTAGQSLILWALTVIAGVASLVALIHAIVQRPDAFPAVDRQSKVIWVSLLAAATAFIWFFKAPGLLYLVGVVAMLVYLVDVRPRVDEIQGKSWFKKA